MHFINLKRVSLNNNFYLSLASQESSKTVKNLLTLKKVQRTNVRQFSQLQMNPHDRRHSTQITW